MQDKGWRLQDSIITPDVLIPRFDLILDDYNFDGQTDLYIQVSASDGWCLSRGHLITIHPKTKKLELHPEARELANMHPDATKKAVWSERTAGYDKEERRQIIIFTNKWISGRLTTVGERTVVIDSAGNFLPSK